jgi:hypothetical protein
MSGKGMQIELMNIQRVGVEFDKHLSQCVFLYRCRNCGFETQGQNLIEFHVFFQCKKKDVHRC